MYEFDKMNVDNVFAALDLQPSQDEITLRPSACDWSEYYFAQTSSNLADTSATTIFLNEQSTPFFLRKGRGQPTSLSLETLEINKKVFPAGSIFTVRAFNEEFVANEDVKRRMVKLQTNFECPETRYISVVKTMPVKGIAVAEFARLSLFAYTIEERNNDELLEISENILEHKPDAAEVINRTTLETIRASIATLLQVS